MLVLCIVNNAGSKTNVSILKFDIPLCMPLQRGGTCMKVLKQTDDQSLLEGNHICCKTSFLP